MTGILCSLPLIGAPTDASSGVSLVVSLNKSSVSASGTSASLTTDSVRATASGGTAPYTYAWAKVSGDSSINASSPSSANTSFQRSGCVTGDTYTGNWKCTATDSAGTSGISANVSVSIARTASTGGGGGGGGGGSSLAATASPSSIIGTGSTSVIVTSSPSVVSASGGASPYTYQWIQVTSDASASATSATSASSTFRRASCVSGNEYFSTWKCTVTDSVGATADTNTVSVDIDRS